MFLQYQEVLLFNVNSGRSEVMSYSCLYPKHLAQWLNSHFSLLSHSPLRRPDGIGKKKGVSATSCSLCSPLDLYTDCSPYPEPQAVPFPDKIFPILQFYVYKLLPSRPLNSPSLDEGDLWVFQVYPNRGTYLMVVYFMVEKNTSSHPQHLAQYPPHHMNLKKVLDDCI